MKRTIEESETSIEDALVRLRKLGESDPAISQALDFLAPRGFRPVVELLEDNHKKRRSAPADKWQPATGEIKIYFEPAPDESTETSSPSPLPPMSELLIALAEAETAPGRTFVALKWFRDEFLPAKTLSWTHDPDQRQALIAKAIVDGSIFTSKVPNPKAPLYPTTTIKVNRQRLHLGSQPVSRFRPVHVSGEPLSATINRDRGSR